MTSKRRLRRKQCGHKRRFASSQQAQGFIDYLENSGLARPGSHPYLCDFCHFWHVGRGKRLIGRKNIKVWEWNAGK